MKKHEIQELLEALGGQVIKEIRKMDQTVPAERPAYETLIDEFTQLDNQVQEILEKFANGKIILDCIPTDGAKDYQELFSKMQAKFIGIQDYAKQLIEQRNAKLQEAANEMRKSVVAPEDQIRGIDAAAQTKRYGAFEVTSKTSRFFSQDTLLPQVQKMGLLPRLMQEATYVDKDSGAIMPAVRQVWEIGYGPVKQWLRENNLESIVQAAYEEEEGTPAVTGPKPIAWLGAEDKTKKGKK